MPLRGCSFYAHNEYEFGEPKHALSDPAYVNAYKALPPVSEPDIHLSNVLVKLPSSFDGLSVKQLYEKYGEPEAVPIARCDGKPLPPNGPTKAVIEIRAYGTSWTRTAEIKTLTSDGKPTSFFRKAQGDIGKGMLHGEFQSMCALHGALASLVPKPIASGTYKIYPDTYFFLCSFHKMNNTECDVWEEFFSQGIEQFFNAEEYHSALGAWGYPSMLLLACRSSSMRVLRMRIMNVGSHSELSPMN
ncbi:hypothetical protein BJX76DRAFT_353777 [Aspergillus varians]